MFHNKKSKKNSRYKDISKLYNIIDILNGNVILYNEKVQQNLYIYVYKIEPVVLINVPENNIAMIISKYIEFLREINCDFQIYIENRKVDINKYFNNNKYILKEQTKNILRNLDYNYQKLYMQYKSSIYQMFSDKKIYTKNFYIIFSSMQKNTDKEGQIDICLSKLNDIGCQVTRIKDDDELQRFIYMAINKINLEEDSEKTNESNITRIY